MNIKYNNIDVAQAHGLVTFSDIPSILEISDTTGGTRATLQLTVNNLYWTATSNNQWWLTFQGNTISNVIDPQNAVNKNFYIASNPQSTAVSIANALRNCPSIAAKFLVYAEGVFVKAKAREIGAIDMTLTMTSGLSTYLSATTIAGSAFSSLVNSKIMVDVKSNEEYLTSLDKNYYRDKCRFDMTPVLATMAKYNKTIPYSFEIKSMDTNGLVSTLGSVTGNSVSVGYKVNQGNNFLTINDGITIAQNVARGKLRDAYNNSLLYVYGNTIPLSFYTTSTANSITVTVSYKDSAFNQITSSTQTLSVVGDGFLHMATLTINVPTDCFYIDVTIGGNKLRYDVIRPMKTSYGCQRVYWINSYGGTSFFDFVGQKTIENTSEVTTYNKNHLDYYTTSINEKELVYNVDTRSTYTVKSHLIAEDGKWQLYDLLQSPYAWTNINGQDYVVIIDSVTEAEQNNQQIFEMTVKFRISQPTSL